MRITKTQKQIVAHTVATNWVTFATRIVSEGGTPCRFTEQLDSHLWNELRNMCGRMGNVENVHEISRRVFNEIRKESISQCKLIVSMNNRK